jgi:hypothetical protein
MSIVKPVIDAPLSAGAVQSITTFVSLFVVVGALGAEGAKACKIVTLGEGELYPTELRASTVNSYVVPRTRPVAV